jgi:hypothetical protein
MSRSRFAQSPDQLLRQFLQQHSYICHFLTKVKTANENLEVLNVATSNTPGMDTLGRVAVTGVSAVAPGLADTKHGSAAGSAQRTSDAATADDGLATTPQNVSPLGKWQHQTMFSQLVNVVR